MSWREIVERETLDTQTAQIKLIDTSLCQKKEHKMSMNESVN